MLTKEDNELIARVGPGTPCGELMRRYWHPVCTAADLTPDRPRKRVKIMGEELVVFRLADGRYGLVEEHCRHRGVSLAYGFCEKEGIRCAYHGWLYDVNGRCLEQPFEPKELSFKERVRLKAYPVETLGGLVFTYMGPPERRPLLPRWDVLVREDGIRDIEIPPVLQCNWLQPMENAVDSIHTFFLHSEYRSRSKGLIPGKDFKRSSMAWYGFQPFEWGLLKSLCFDNDKTVRFYARPLIFPNMIRRGDKLHWRVPIDDVTTWLVALEFKPSPEGRKVEHPEVFDYVPSVLNDEGEYKMDSAISQDGMACETAGPLFDRSQEQLGASDRGITMYRKMLREQIQVVKDGGDPMALVWDPKKNEVIDLWAQYMGTESGSDSMHRDGSSKARGRRFEEVFDDTRHEVFEVPFGEARPNPVKIN